MAPLEGSMMNEENWKTLAELAAEQDAKVSSFLLYCLHRADAYPDHDGYCGRQGRLLEAIGRTMQGLS